MTMRTPLARKKEAIKDYISGRKLTFSLSGTDELSIDLRRTPGTADWKLQKNGCEQQKLVLLSLKYKYNVVPNELMSACSFC